MPVHDMGIDTGWGTEIHIPCLTTTPTADEARKAFKAALKREKAARKAAKAKRKALAQRQADRELAMETLRDLVRTGVTHGDRIQAATELLDRA